jgi:hypothetical protein
MKKFNFIEPIKVKPGGYPNVNSVYRKEGDDVDGDKDFFSYEDGHKVEDETTQRWVNDTIQHLLDKPEEQYCYLLSGDTLVISVREEDGIQVFVSKSNMNAYVPLYEYDNEETL